MFTITDVGLQTVFSLRANSDGSISPSIHFIDLKLGKMKISVDNPVVEWFARQVINTGKVLLENSINLVGWPIISVMAGPIIQQLLTNY